jgi:O-antigen/teichoic acid export membrane protein
MKKLKVLFQRLIKPEEYSLKIKSIRAGIWSVLGKGGSYFLRMVGSLILTRLLFPEAFGLMATATIVLTIIELFSYTGVQTAIVQNPRGGEPGFLNTAWIITIIRGFVIFAAVLLLASPIARFYGEPQLKGLISILAFNTLIFGFENPAIYLAVKRFRVEKQILLELVTQVLGLASSIVLAAILRSVYALAIGSVLSTVYMVIGTYIVDKYRPRLEWDREAGRELFHFGKFIFLNTMITWAAMNADIILIGKILKMKILGLYKLGENFGDMVPQFIEQVVAQSYFPAISEVQEDRERVFRIYRRSVSFVIALAVPASVILAIFSYDIIRLLYDPRYQLAYVSMLCLCFSAVFKTISTITGTTFIAMGKPKFETISMTIGFVFIVVFVLIGSRLGGLWGASIAMFSAYTLLAVVESIIMGISLKFPLGVILRPWAQAISVSLAIGGIFYLLRPWLASEKYYSIPFMAVMGLVGIGISVGIYFLLEGGNPFKDMGGASKVEK